MLLQAVLHLPLFPGVGGPGAFGQCGGGVMSDVKVCTHSVALLVIIGVQDVSGEISGSGCGMLTRYPEGTFHVGVRCTGCGARLAGKVTVQK